MNADRGLEPTATVEPSDSGEILRFALDCVSEAVYLVGADAQFAFVNANACTELGYDRDELLRMTVADINPDIPGERQTEILAQIHQAGHSVILSSHRRKDGTVFPVEVSVQPCTFNGVEYKLALAQDITSRIQVEEELAEAIQREARILRSVTDLILTYDRDWRFTYLNDSAQASLGRSREELLGHCMWELYPRMLDHEGFRRLKDLGDRGVTGEYEAYNVHTDHWIEGTVYPSADGLTVYCRNVTQRKVAQQGCDYKNRLLRIIGASGQALFRNSDEIELLSEISRILVEVGRYPMAWIGFAETDECKSIRAAAMAGEHEGYVDTLDLTWEARGVGFGPAGTTIRSGLPVVQRGLESAEGVPFEAVRRGYRCIAALPLHNLTDTIGAMLVYSRDPAAFDEEEIDLLAELASDVSRAVFAIRLRELKNKAEEEARLANHQRIDTLESITDMFVAFDREGRFTYVNERAAESRGWPRDEMVGKLFGEVYPELVGSNANVETLRAMMEGRPTHFEFQNPLSERWYETDAYPAKDGVTVYTREISDRKRAAAEREALEVQLREAQKIEAIGTLAGGIAHDFNNILGTILGNVQLAIEDCQGNSLALESLEEIRSASVRARDLTRQILYFGRRQPHEKKTVALGPVVENAANLLRSTLPARVHVVASVSCPKISVLGDPTQLLQILVNLGTNAAHAIGDRSGHIHMDVDSLKVCESTPVGICDLGPGDYARISVRDNGQGMDDDTISHVFEPFFTTKGVGEGTGLGLSVVHGIVKSHGGQVAVHSTLGQGATFEVYLPLIAPDELLGDSHPTRPETESGNGVHLLCVDDDEQLIGLLSRMLSRHGYRVTCFLDTASALEALRADASQFDVVLTDLNMPGHSGLELSAEIHRLLPDMPVGIASGIITDEIRSRAQAAGVAELIQKPIAMQEYLEVIKRLLASRQTNAARR